MTLHKKIFCCNCNSEVQARLTSGKEVYRHRKDLYEVPFWICDTCGGFVGCYYKTANRIKPLGCIPSPQIKELRKQIHAELDPLWKKGLISRGNLYRELSEVVGRQYHTAEIRTVDEAQRVLVKIRQWSLELDTTND